MHIVYKQSRNANLKITFMKHLTLFGLLAVLLAGCGKHNAPTATEQEQRQAEDKRRQVEDEQRRTVDAARAVEDKRRAAEDAARAVEDARRRAVDAARETNRQAAAIN